MQKKTKADGLGHLLDVKDAFAKMEILFQQVDVLRVNCRGNFPEPAFLADFLAKVRNQKTRSTSNAAQLFTRRGGPDQSKHGWLTKDKLPSNIVGFICSKIPRLDKEHLCHKDVGTFRQHIDDIVSAGFAKREHSEAAEEYYRINRPKLQKWIRSYYSAIQQAPSELGDFPLVVDRGYLVKEPILLSEPQEEQLLLCSDEFFNDNSFPNAAAEDQYFFGRSYLKFRTDYRETLSGTTPGTHSGCSYRLMKVEPTDAFPRLHFARSRYYSYINTCEVRGFEAAYFRAILREQDALSMSRSERCLFRRDPRSVFDLSNRNAIAGVNTFTIIVDRKTDTAHFLQHKRSEHDVGEAIKTTHVVPAGTFQPLIRRDLTDVEALASKAWKRDLSLIKNIVREFLEECLYLEDEINAVANHHDWWKRSEKIRRPYNAIYDALAEQKLAKAWFLGVGFDRLTEKPELLTALVIDTSLVQTLKWNPEGFGQPVLLTEDVLRTIIERGTNEWLSAGMACVQLVNRRFRRLRYCLSD